MSICPTTTRSTTSGKTTSSATSPAASTTSTATEVSPVSGSVAIFGVLDRTWVFFVLLAVNGTPLFNLAFERGIQ